MNSEQSETPIYQILTLVGAGVALYSAAVVSAESMTAAVVGVVVGITVMATAVYGESTGSEAE